MGNSGSKTQLDLVRVMVDDRSLFRALDAGRYYAELEVKPADAFRIIDSLGADDEALAKRADKLRAAVCLEMEKHREEVQKLLNDGQGDGLGGGHFHTYHTELKNFWIPGGKIELSMAVHVVKRPIWVFRPKHLGGKPGFRYGDELIVIPSRLGCCGTLEATRLKDRSMDVDIMRCLYQQSGDFMMGKLDGCVIGELGLERWIALIQYPPSPPSSRTALIV
jgi:hypothetical protein